MNGTEVLPGIWHIQDNMGVCMTLLTGEKRGLLVDTGYGMEDTEAYLGRLTNLPYDVLLTHGHHDHVLGSVQFSRTMMRKEDLDEFVLRTGPQQRARVAEQAEQKGLQIPDGFMTAHIPTPVNIEMTDTICGFDCTDIDLGGRILRIIKVPGHTAGSVVIWSEQDRLLLTGDDWNPCTWLWFPCSSGVREWRNGMTRLTETLPFEYVLCSHQPMLRTKDELCGYIGYLDDARLLLAESVDMGSPVRTKQVRFGNEYVFVFDDDKFRRE